MPLYLGACELEHEMAPKQEIPKVDKPEERKDRHKKTRKFFQRQEHACFKKHASPKIQVFQTL
jgi:hypothetical protein